MLTYSFRLPKDGSEQFIERLVNKEEANRFCELFDSKNYLPDISWNMELFDAFGEFFEEKVRLEKASIPYDNLLDPSVSNPDLRPKNGISAIIKKQIEILD